MFRLGIGTISLALAATAANSQVVRHPPAPEGDRHYPEASRGTAKTYEQWYSQTSSDTVIIFVHGIFSNNRGAWWFHDERARADSSKDVYWPELVAQDTRFGSPSIFLAGYYTAPGSGQYDVAQAARALADRLNLTDPGGRVLKKRNIVFVAHSTGGLIVSYLLYHHRHLFRGKNVGLVLMASPAKGSEWADRLSLVIQAARNRMADQLRTRSEFRNELLNNFREFVDDKLVPGFALEGASACENHFVLDGWAWRNRHVVVDENSCASFFGAPLIIRDTDHFSVVKPYGRQSQSHEFLLGFVENKFGPLVRQQTAAADTIRVTVRPKVELFAVVDSIWTANKQLPDIPCSSDSTYEIRFSQPLGWRLPENTRISARLSDSATADLVSIADDRDSGLVALVRRRTAVTDANAGCAPSSGIVVTITAPINVTRVRETRLTDSTVVILSRNSPQRVVDLPVARIPSGHFAKWTYGMHVNGTVQGVPLNTPLRDEMTFGRLAISSYVLADGRLVLTAMQMP